MTSDAGNTAEIDCRSGVSRDRETHMRLCREVAVAAHAAPTGGLRDLHSVLVSLRDRSSLDGFALHIPGRLGPHRTIRASMHAALRRQRPRAVKAAQRLAGGIAK
jgi:hypothetical protein